METAVVQLYAVVPRAITNTWTSVSANDPCSARRGRGEMTGDITTTYHDRIQVTNRGQLAAIVQELEAWQQVHFQRFESSCTITKNFSDPAASNSTCVEQLETHTQWYQGTHVTAQDDGVTQVDLREKVTCIRSRTLSSSP